MFKLKELYRSGLIIGFLLIFLVSCSSNEPTSIDPNNLRKEIRELEAIAKANPEDYKIFYNLGLAYSKANEMDKSLENFKTAVKLNSDFDKAYTNIGCILYTQKNFPEAIENFNRALTLAPEDGKVYYNLGLAYYKNGEFDEALKALKRAKYYDGSLLKQVNSIIEMIPAR